MGLNIINDVTLTELELILSHFSLFLHGID